MECKKCKSKNLGVRKNAKNSNHTDLYCKDCGAWQKFATADEIRLYSQSEFIDLETLPIVQELKQQLEQVKKERDAAITDLEALMWLTGEGCKLCKHHKITQKEPFVKIICTMKSDCQPKWRGIQEEEDD